MKIQNINLSIVPKIGFWTLSAMLLFIHSTGLSNTVKTPSDLLVKTEAGKDDKENVAGDSKTCQNDDETLSIQENNGLLFSFDTKGNGIFIKLFKKNMGNYLQFTQLPVKWIAEHRNNEVPETEINDNDKNCWSSNISFDINAGFMHHAGNTETEQYIAVSGQLNRFYVGIILILTT